MLIKDIITAILIHLIIPGAGLFIYWILYKKIEKEQIYNPPIKELFLIFATYGGLLLVLLTSLFWMWSGAASLGVFYLVLVAPILMAIIAIRTKNNRNISRYHRWAFTASVLYFGVAPLTLAGVYLVIDYIEKA